jgi:hypothetical protein
VVPVELQFAGVAVSQAVAVIGLDPSGIAGESGPQLYMPDAGVVVVQSTVLDPSRIVTIAPESVVPVRVNVLILAG